MDIASIIGLVGGIGVLVYGMLSGGDLASFFDAPSVVMTIGGGLVSTIVSFSLEEFLNVAKVLPKIIYGKTTPPFDLIRSLVDLSQKARREGLLALESAGDTINDDFMKKAMELVVDGVEADIIRESLTLELDNMAIRHKSGISIFKTMGTFFPAWGMIGTLVGLVNLLKSLDDPSKIGPAMAIAIITTFYGSVMANFVAIPIANKLASKSDEEIRIKEMMIEGILGIQAGVNPRIMEHKLKTFLSPTQKKAYDAMIASPEKPEAEE